MDYDHDGILDIVTGSYTGQLYLFRGLAADGPADASTTTAAAATSASTGLPRFGKREHLRNVDGKAIILPEYSVVPELVDMDEDDDLDLVVGARSDPVLVIENVGTRSEPKWSTEFQPLKTKKGTVIEGSNAHHADWNGDGRVDLIVGSEHGAVHWYRNVGRKGGRPRYAEAKLLVAQPAYRKRDPDGTRPEKPCGQRVKVHVCDWNGNRRPDLLVGDVTWQTSGQKIKTHGFVWLYER